MIKTVIIAAAAAICAVSFKASATADKDGPKIGDAPPPLALTQTLQGPLPKELDWEKLKGKVVVLEFWATWCGPCVKSIPHLNSLVQQFQNKPVVFVSVTSEGEGVVRKFLKAHPIKAWVGLDDYETLGKSFHVRGIPHVVVINTEGKIAGITHPSRLEPRHLEEAMNGRLCSLPEPAVDTRSFLDETVSAEPPPLYEISIRKLNVPKTIQGPACSWKAEPDGTGFEGKLATVESALQSVFDKNQARIKIRGRLPEGFYDFALRTTPGHLPELKSQFIAALRTSFDLEVKETVREMESYKLTVLNTNSAGLRPTDKQGGGGQTRGGFRLHGSSMKGVADFLELALNAPVLDETGLGGLYDVDMKWEVTDEGSAYHPKPSEVIQAARTRLGLELTPVRRPVQILEVRSAGR